MKMKTAIELLSSAVKSASVTDDERGHFKRLTACSSAKTSVGTPICGIVHQKEVNMKEVEIKYHAIEYTLLKQAKEYVKLHQSETEKVEKVQASIQRYINATWDGVDEISQIYAQELYELIR